MGLRIGINGFGRIGRNVFRAIRRRSDDMQVVAINDLTDAPTLAHLLKYDTVFGRFDGEIQASEGCLEIDGRAVKVWAEKDPGAIPWKEQSTDVVIESTGVFRKRAQIEKHFQGGARKIVLTVPAKDAIDAMIVMGVNDDALKAEHRIVSNASCTTNCVAPMAKVLHDSFGIERAFMTTVHAYTNDQRILDFVHKDLRRARSAPQNIIPTTTGAARAVGKVLPDLAGKLDGLAMRVPVPDGSIVDLVSHLHKAVTAEQVNEAFAKAAQTAPLKCVLEYCEDPIVSSDIVGSSFSCVFDARSTMVLDGNLVKTLAWYDNEWAYSVRVTDLAARLGRTS